MKRFYGLAALMAVCVFAPAAQALECSDVRLWVDLSAQDVLTVNDVATDLNGLREAAQRKDDACRDSAAFATFVHERTAGSAAVRDLLLATVNNITLVELIRSPAPAAEAAAPDGKPE